MLIKVYKTSKLLVWTHRLLASIIFWCNALAMKFFWLKLLPVQCLKFKTDQAQDAKKMEKLNNIFFALMTRGPDGIMLCFLQDLQSLKIKHWILFVSLIWVPILWIVQLISVKFQGRNRQSNSNRRKVGEGGNDAGLILISFRKFTTGMVDWHFIDSCCPPCYGTLKEVFSSTEPRTNWMHTIMNSWLRNAWALDLYLFFLLDTLLDLYLVYCLLGGILQGMLIYSN